MKFLTANKDKPSDQLDKALSFSFGQIQSLFDNKNMSFPYKGKEYGITFLSVDPKKSGCITYAVEKDGNVLGSFDFDPKMFVFHSLDSNQYDKGVCSAVLDSLNTQSASVKTAWEVSSLRERMNNDIVKIFQ